MDFYEAIKNTKRLDYEREAKELESNISEVFNFLLRDWQYQVTVSAEPDLRASL